MPTTDEEIGEEFMGQSVSVRGWLFPTISFFFFLYFSLIQYTPAGTSPPSAPPSPYPRFSDSHQKRAGLQRISTKHGIARYNKTKQNLDWTRQPSRRKRVLRAGKGVRASPDSHCQESHENTKLNDHNVSVTVLGQTHASSLTATFSPLWAHHVIPA